MKNIKDDTFKTLVRKSVEIKRLILNISYKAQVGHIAPALSIADILTVLYFGILNVDPKKPRAKNRDFFILSKPIIQDYSDMGNSLTNLEKASSYIVLCFKVFTRPECLFLRFSEHKNY